MALVVEPNDIKNNEKEAEKLQKELEDALKLKETVTESFTRLLKQLEKSEKDMKDIVNNAKDRCQYHHKLKKDVELRLAGKRRPDVEAEDDRRVTDFLDVVKKVEGPRFTRVLKEFEDALNAVKNALK